MRVWMSADGHWRVEQRRDGFWVIWLPEAGVRRGVARLGRATRDEAVVYLRQQGVEELRPA